MRMGTLLTGVSLGAGLMYLLDPVMGPRRRARLQDQLSRSGALDVETLGRRSRDLTHRAQDFIDDMRRGARREPLTDEELLTRIRSRMGLAVSRPRAIEVNADNGRIILSGQINASEIDRLLSTISNIPGVQFVENRLEELEETGSEPSRQSPRA